MEVTTRKSPHSLKNRFLRFLWGLVWLFLFRPSPRLLRGWRRFLLRLFGASLARGAKVYSSCRIWAPWNLAMGEHSTLGDDVDCYNVAPIELGAGAVVSQHTHLCTASHDYEDPTFPLISRPIKICDRAWVAAGAFLGPGVTIGQDAVVAARACVVKDVDPAVVVGGNPARIIKHRDLPVTGPRGD